MNRIINKRQAVCGTVWVIIVCAVLSMWPLRLIKETIVSDSNRQMVMESGEIVSGSAVQQMFAAQYDRLKNINIYITEGTIGEEFNFVLYDAAMGVIMQQVINTKDMKSIPGDCRVQVNIDTEVGQAYYLRYRGWNLRSGQALRRRQLPAILITARLFTAAWRTGSTA